MADAQCAAGEGVDGGAVAGAVVGHHGLDVDAVADVEGDRPLQETDGGGGLLVVEDFDVGQAGGVVDADVHVLPADELSVAAGRVTSARAALQRSIAVDAVSGAAFGDPSELFDIDVQQLAGVAALVAVRWLGRLQPAALAKPHAQQQRRDRRGRHPETERDLGARHPQLAQHDNDLDEIVGRAVRDRVRRRGTVKQPGLALSPIARDPLRAGPLAHAGGHRRLRERPPLLEHPTHHRQPALRAERRVSVNLHPVSSLD